MGFFAKVMILVPLAYAEARPKIQENSKSFLESIIWGNFRISEIQNVGKDMLQDLWTLEILKLGFANFEILEIWKMKLGNSKL